MKKQIQRIVIVLSIIVTVLACTKDDSSTEPVVITGGEVFLSQLVIIDLPNTTLSENEYHGALDGLDVSITKIDEHMLTFLVPSNSQLGLKDLKIPSLNNLTIHYDVKETVLTDTPDVVLADFKSGVDTFLGTIDQSDIDYPAIQQSVESFNAIYNNATDTEKEKIAIFYQSNKTLLDGLLSGDVSALTNKGVVETWGCLYSIRRDVIGFGAGVFLVIAGDPISKAVGVVGVIAFGKRIGKKNCFMDEGVLFNSVDFSVNSSGKSISSKETSVISLVDDTEKIIKINSNKRAVTQSDNGASAKGLKYFFLYYNKFNEVVSELNSTIKWVNENVLLANFSLVSPMKVAQTNPSVDFLINSETFSKFKFTISHSNLTLVSASFAGNGQLSLNVKIKGSPATLPVVSILKYSYSDDFNTLSGSIPISVESDGCGNTTDIDGNVYSAVKIGAQCWTKTNLNVSRYRNGDVIPQITDPTTWANLTTGAWCYYENKSVNGTTYGKLYNWYAVTDSRGLAPDGWHVPSDAEWTTLTTFLGGENVAGGKMKATKGWASGGGMATNSSGFTALGGGVLNRDGTSSTFSGIGEYGSWWSTTWSKEDDYWHRFLGFNFDGIIKEDSNAAHGYSVRCIKD